MDSPTDQTDLKNSIINKSTILYAEDENILREEVSNILQGFFQKVFIASNGEEALDIYEKKKKEIDILLADINMPKMKGIELISQIRQYKLENYISGFGLVWLNCVDKAQILKAS